ncbi:unnamed protein product [Fusarium graminearum]|nr:unnamed protein product [Fusarium graminearum]VTO82873.1 unnamed protein product [Fusarium graminearum]
MVSLFGTSSAYSLETSVLASLKDEHDDWRQDEGAAKNDSANLPRDLTLAGTRVDPLHDGQNINRRKDVKDLEDNVPWHTLSKQVEIAGAEDESVQDLRDEGDALGAAVAVDGEDEDAFREGVGQVAQNTEELDRDCQLWGFHHGCILECVRTFHAPIVRAGCSSELC